MATRGRHPVVIQKSSSSKLSKRALNRALLARQLLLNRSSDTVLNALTHLVGLQAQTPNSPYIALWSRLHDFHPQWLTELIQGRRVVRIALMRSTIHSVTDEDCLELRPHVGGVLERGMRGAFGKQLEGLNLKQVQATARKFLEQGPLTLDELGKALSKKWPGRNAAALANAARALLPLIQIPPRGIWGEGGLAKHALAELWLNKPLSASPSLERMITRYLAAFGPASVRDVQTWSGLTGLRSILEKMRPALITFTDEDGNELFDLPSAPRPDLDTPAPPRFLPVFDNVLLSHHDRRRILSEDHRKMLFGTAALLEGSLLVDGFVSGTWKVVQEPKMAILFIQPFAALRKSDQAAISEEGANLLRFVVPDVSQHRVQIALPAIR